MGVPAKVVSWLRKCGHNATHLREEGLQRLPDREIFGKAVAENRVILTFDLDFGEIAALSEDEKCGVVVFRLRNTRTLTCSPGSIRSWPLPLLLSKRERWWLSKKRGIGSGAYRSARAESTIALRCGEDHWQLVPRRANAKSRLRSIVARDSMNSYTAFV